MTLSLRGVQVFLGTDLGCTQRGRNSHDMYVTDRPAESRTHHGGGPTSRRPGGLFGCLHHAGDEGGAGAFVCGEHL